MGVFSMMRQFQMLPFRTENDYGFLPLSHIAPDHLQDQAESGDVDFFSCHVVKMQGGNHDLDCDVMGAAKNSSRYGSPMTIPSSS
mmetsp:Transcript_104673/g.168437  ORF Transcript_104673/g.168437 Transcript_104673/m.168437 type:complete len:85 (+) Transcript_104673:77-331(+)|eukprot:CAMPEP_0179437374 /NCGR_PEP_ID=MMETSP0799-20121207/21280_1 /TAXON_ID=46947 /ORGANISM="Geminigera cryophila, Strain CCMP2564" /LENGTH=84 /DNA_ID=CAMNT_0021218273 /DNA_START=77 /DNA_END=331 /DNA_ORIENTATION=+